MDAGVKGPSLSVETLNYPLEWKRTVRSAWQELVPTLRRNHHYVSAERVYGKYL